jgi:hypothetical protein
VLLTTYYLLAAGCWLLELRARNQVGRKKKL